MERRTKFLASHPNNLERYTEIHVLRRQRIEDGGESKERIKGVVKTSKQEKFVYLIRRNFDDNFPSNTSWNKLISQQTQERWHRYQDAKLPTYNTIRVVQDGSLLVTDETADGSRLYGNPDFLRVLREGGKLRNKKDSILDSIFISLISSEEIKAIKEKTDRTVELASHNKIGLPLHDPFELIVHPNGSWDVKTIDVAESQYKEDVYRTQLFNDGCTNYFITYLEKTRDELINYQKRGLIRNLLNYTKYNLKKLHKNITLAIRMW